MGNLIWSQTCFHFTLLNTFPGKQSRNWRSRLFGEAALRAEFRLTGATTRGKLLQRDEPAFDVSFVRL